MAAPIYVRTKELVISDAKKASSYIEDAISAMSKVDNAVSGWALYIDAAADGFVFAKSESEVSACLSALRTKQTQLEKLISVMQTGTDKLEEADVSFKNEITDSNLWERLTNAIGRAIYSSTIGKVDALILGVAWLGTLFNVDASTTNVITYQHIIDEFDWSRTKLSDEDIKKIIDAERKLAEMKGEKLTDQQIRKKLQCLYDVNIKPNERLGVDLVPQPTDSDCGPTSAYMVIKYLNPDSDITLAEVKRQYADSGYILGGLNNTIKEATNQPYSYKANLSKADLLTTIQSSIENGYPCMALGRSPASTNPLGYTTPGHYVVVSGVFQAANGTWMVEITDPYSSGWTKSSPTGQVITISIDDLYGFCHQRDDGGYLIFGKPS